ncbi:phage major capsid protein [Gemella sanguinis]|uniref:phage major capsid protein n=1 Tax=Gemella sanguinis TaxID=84135 RepID=UPI0028ED03D4|nr:phage major capsid protein [Gemella sanguinis]
MNMNKKLRELMQLKAEKVTMAENAINNKETELANSLMEEIKGYTEEINQIQNLISYKNDDKVVDLAEEKKEETGLVAVKNYIKSGIVNAAGPLKESEGENGGYLVPEDVRTAINEYRRSFVSLKDYVDVRSVVVPSGSEVYEKTSQLTGLTNITELGEIQEMNAEVFERITYKVKDFGGILPVSRFLLQDSPENLLAYLGKWFMKKQVVTENKEIIAVLKTLTKKAITKVDEIKEAFNVTLDPIFLDNTKVLTNQSGFNILDSLKDKNGNYLLQPVVTDPTKRTLFGKEVIVLPDTHLPNEAANKFPLYVGDLKEAVRVYELNELEIKSTDVGGKSFTRNSYDTRLITRFDVKAVDKEAVVKLEFGKDLTLVAGA